MGVAELKDVAAERGMCQQMSRMRERSRHEGEGEGKGEGEARARAGKGEGVGQVVVVGTGLVVALQMRPVKESRERGHLPWKHGWNIGCNHAWAGHLPSDLSMARGLSEASAISSCCPAKRRSGSRGSPAGIVAGSDRRPTTSSGWVVGLGASGGYCSMTKQAGP